MTPLAPALSEFSALWPVTLGALLCALVAMTVVAGRGRRFAALCVLAYAAGGGLILQALLGHGAWHVALVAAAALLVLGAMLRLAGAEAGGPSFWGPVSDPDQ